MTALIDSAYQTLGLKPLQDYLLERYEHNKAHRNFAWGEDSPELFRGVGATTWMCVEAAAVLAHMNVLIVGFHGRDQADQMVGMVRGFAHKLHGLTGTPGAWDKQDQIMIMSNQRQIHHTTKRDRESRVVGVPGFRQPGKIFDDAFWKDKAIKRIQGPFAMARFIREIRDDEGVPHYHVFDEDQQFLMELPKKGALKLAQKIQTKIETWDVLGGKRMKVAPTHPPKTRIT